MAHKGPKNPERSFGVSVGSVLLLIAAVLVWKGRLGRAEVLGGVGAVLLVLGLTRPMLLKVPSDLWWAFSRILGAFNARVLMSVLFFIVLTPLAMVWRLTGKDPLGRRRSPASGWAPYPARLRDPKHFEHMF